MQRSLANLLRMGGPAFTMITGLSGVGKTRELLEFKQQSRRVFMHTVVAAESRPFTLAAGLMKMLDLPGAPNGRDLPASREQIADAIGANGVLLLDEGQHLVQFNSRGSDSLETLEWVRQMAEEGCFSVAFCGDLRLAELVEKVPQLRRRIIRPVIIRRVPKADVATVAAHHSVTAPEAVEALYGVARRYGALADVVNVLNHARLFAGGAAVQVGHIVAAIEDLKLGPKGGR